MVLIIYGFNQQWLLKEIFSFGVMQVI